MSHVINNDFKRAQIHTQSKNRSRSYESEDSSINYSEYNSSLDRTASSNWSSHDHGGSSSFINENSRSQTPRVANFRNKKATTPTPETTGSKWGVVLFIIFLLLAILTYKFISKDTKCNINSLQKQYSQYHKLNAAVELLVEQSLKNNDHGLGVFLLLHKQHQPERAYVHELAKQAAICLNKMPVINITLEDFMICPRDYGCTVSRYRELSETSTVVVIQDLNKIPAEAAQALHEICDTYHPMAKPALTFLTLTVPNDYVIKETARRTAYKLLEELWSTMPPNLLAAVIARVTDQVFWLGADTQSIAFA